LIVATNPNQDADLEEILQKATNNGVPKMSRLTKEQVLAMEPNLNASSALLSESTGVIDSHGYMLSLLGGFEDAGGMIAYQSPLIKATPIQDGKNGYLLEVGGEEPFELETKYLINCAGLSAPAIAQRVDGLQEQFIPKAYFAKGNYFSLSGKSPFSRLIYPVPEPGGLGVHLTLDMGGQAKFGPDVEWLDIDREEQINYTVDKERGQKFYAAVRQYWPGLQDGALNADYSGVRAKISAPGEPAADFRIDDQQIHGLEGLVNLYGFESPGLTSSLAIAQEVVGLLNRV
jgi:L-2-hydroxyglutarate oxidase LhgO